MFPQNEKKKPKTVIHSCLSLRIMGMEQIPLPINHDDAVESTGGPGLGTSADVPMFSPDGSLVLTTICPLNYSKL